MTTVKVTSDEITILPPEIKEKVTQEISTALVEANATDELIVKMKKEFMPLTIKNSNDKEGYLIVKETRKQVKKLRVFAEKVFKKGREEANLVVREWLNKQNEIIPQFKEVESYLEKQEEEYEAAELFRKQQEKLKLEQQAAERMRDLISFGAKMDGSYWGLNGVSYEISLVKEADPEIWADIRGQFETEFNKAEEVRLAAEEKQRQDQEKLAEQQREAAAQLAEAKKMRVEGRISFLRSLGMATTGERTVWLYEDQIVQSSVIENANAEEWEAIAAKVTEGVANAKDRAALEAEFKRVFADRFMRLKEWSTNGHFVYYSKGKEWGSIGDIVSLSDEDFEELVKSNDAYISDRGKEQERQAIAKGVGMSRRSDLIFVNGMSSLSDAELGDVSNEEWAAMYIEAKNKFDASQKEVAQQKEKERQELLGEKQKYEELVEKIIAIEVPVLKSGQYRAKTNIIRDFIEGLKSKL